jgi:hypothetical protein
LGFRRFLAHLPSGRKKVQVEQGDAEHVYENTTKMGDLQAE